MENFEELIEKDCFLKNIKRCYIIKIIESFNIEKLHIVYNNDIKSFEIKFMKDNIPYFFKYKVKRRRNDSVSRKNKKVKNLDINTNINSENTNCFNEHSNESTLYNSNCSKNNSKKNQDNNELYMENNNFFKCKNKNCIFEVDRKDSYCRLCVNYVRNCVKCNNEFADEITIIDICDNCDNTDIIEYNIDGNESEIDELETSSDETGCEDISDKKVKKVKTNNIQNNINNLNYSRDILKKEIINNYEKLFEHLLVYVKLVGKINNILKRNNPKKAFLELNKISNEIEKLKNSPEELEKINDDVIALTNQL